MNDREPERPENGEVDAAPEIANAFGRTMDMKGDTASGAAGGLRQQPEEWVGRRLGKYEITGILGVGGMGYVLRAHDTSIERDVAIKVLPVELSVDEVVLGRFLAEAKSAGKLNHPNIVTIYEVAQDGPTHYLVMEVVSGGSAEEHLEQHGAYSVSDATRMAIETCCGLTAAHEAGLIHRDIKPANLLLTPDGRVKVADFGLAKRTQNKTLQVTKAGQIIGTPYYMSPEQCESREADARSDVYSLGATYYGLLTGKSPYQDSGSVVQVMYAHCNADPPDPREIRASVPVACAQIIERAMATNPDQRYPSTEAMRSDLEAVLAALSGVGIRLPSQNAANRARATPGDVAGGTGAGGKRSFAWLLAAGIFATLAVAATVGFLLSGGETPDAGTHGQAELASPAGAVPPPTGDPIRVGVLHSLTGTMADSESPVVDATLLAIAELNDAGGLLGRPVEAVVADGRSDPVIFAQEAARLINDEQTCTIFGCWTSASRKTIVPVFEEFDHLLIYPVQYEGIEESPNVIYLGAAPNQQIIPAVNWAFAFENKRRFFLVGSDYVFPRVAHEIIKDELQELGAEFVGEAFLSLGSLDVRATIDEIQQAQPDVILNCINGDTNTAFFAELRKAGITPATIPTISFSFGEEELRHLNIATMTGDYAAWNYFQSVDSPENQAFVASFHQKYGPQRVLTDPMEAAYFGVKLWAKAVQDAESDDTRAIRRAMQNQRMRSPGGDVRIDPSTQHTFKTPRIGQLQEDGQFEIVWSAAEPEPPIPYPASRSTEQWRAFLHDLYRAWGNQWVAPANE